MRTIACLTALVLAWPAMASDTCTDDAMLVFDGSGSMAENGFNNLQEPRIFQARRAVARIMPQFASVRDIGLIIYGPGGTDGCTGIDLRFPPRPDAARDIAAAISSVEPAGDTALTEAVARAASVLQSDVRPGTIVLVTDGKETCGGAPCQLAATLAADSADLTIHVIGFRVRGAHFAWEDQEGAETISRCLADTTGGLYVSAETADDLVAALRVTLGCKLLF